MSGVRSRTAADAAPASTGVPAIPAGVEGLDARGVLRLVLDTLSRERLALSTSFGLEGLVILDLLLGLEPRARVFTLDTGRLPEETYELMERVRARYGIEIEVFAPEAHDVEAMVRTRGPNLFYGSFEDRLRCCEVRKVRPLRRALAGLDGWIVGLRRDQAPTRSATPKVSLDLEHGLIWKVAPLADWTADEVWTYVRAHDLPYNALHDRGYPSIGCAPCTRAVEAGGDPRSGRWWWEGPEARECGIHVGREDLLAAVSAGSAR
ncbi:MAG TPA: phosphoadenylyl-sulfate reductase [Candidatus Limnocylindrales bacterium]